MPQSEIQRFAEKIRLSAENHEEVPESLATSQRIIARVTDGIYREPWAAFRELIANAYDADATRVIVTTGTPDFEQVTVRDNGIGMSPDTLAYVLKSIGGSSKRTSIGKALNTSNPKNINFSPGGRRLIGKIGIGLFAVAQLTQHFQIITKATGEKLRTSATIKLKTHDENRLEKEHTDTDSDYIAGDVVVKSEQVPEDEINAQGTDIVLYSLRPGIRRTLQSLRRWEANLTDGVDGKPITEIPLYHIGLPPKTLEKDHEGFNPILPWEPEDDASTRFSKLFDAAAEGSGKSSKPADLAHFDEYLRPIWKLSLSLPLDYIRGHPFDISEADGIILYSVSDGIGQAEKISLPNNKTIKDHLNSVATEEDPRRGFEVFLDGIQLRRPIDLPTTLKKSSRIGSPVMMVAKNVAPFYEKNLERAGGPLSFEAYLYWNSKIIPKDTAGVLLRINNASGTLFDPTFLNYQVSEQMRLRQVTAEVFVTEGLDSAINIDRESFNYSHPHYLYIQRWLHTSLRLFINRLKAHADEDLQRERAAQAKERSHAMAHSAMKVWIARRGESSDKPIEFQDNKSVPPSEVGGTEITWEGIVLKEGTHEQASALAVVLEAYDVLSGLSAQSRAELINDILSIINRPS